MTGPSTPPSGPLGAPAPTTASQVAAYRFAHRRLQSALVRREPVPGRGGGDPLRTQGRAVLAGVLVAVLVLGGVAVWGVLNHPARWQDATIVVGHDSGAMAVVLQNPSRLQPVPNLASARLVLAAGPTGSSGRGTDAAEPVDVADADIADAPRQAPVGIPDAPALPSGTTPGEPAASAVWSVCDTGSPALGDPEPWARPTLWTTVIAAPTPAGRPLGPGEGLLLRDRFGGTWLAHDGVRARIELSDPVIVAFGLGGRLPRPVTTSVLNAIPEAAPIAVPALPDRGARAPVDLAGEPIGGVVRLVGTGTPDRWFVVERDGVQEVSPVVARLVRLADPDPGRAAAPVPAVSPGQLAGVGVGRAIAVTAYPDPVPTTVPMADASTQCLSSGGGDAAPRVTVLSGPPPTPVAPTVLASADLSGDRVDAVSVPGGGLVVRPVPAGRPDASGPITVVSGSGTAFGVPDPRTTQALGLPTAVPPAPESVIGLLPAGPGLTIESALRPLAGSR